LRDLAIDYQDATDGIERKRKDGLATFHDYQSYLNAILDLMKRWVAVVIADAPHRHSDLSQQCLQLWIMVHQSPARWLDFDKFVYSPPYHVLSVLSEMRCEGGLRIRISDRSDYGTHRRYECEEVEIVTAIPFDEDVANYMPLKKDLGKLFCSVRVVDSTERITQLAQHKHSEKKGHNSFTWCNRRFSKSQTLLRSCLDDYHRIERTE
jgi:hypothetical protein